jgi:hypothetical protein
MLAMEKLVKLIIVIMVVVAVILWFYNADINRYLKNAIPSYKTPEHEEVPVEIIDGVDTSIACGNGWEQIAIIKSEEVERGNLVFNSNERKIKFCFGGDCANLKDVDLYIPRDSGNFEVHFYSGDTGWDWIPNGRYASSYKVGTIQNDVFKIDEEYLANGIEDGADKEYFKMLHLSKINKAYICKRTEFIDKYCVINLDKLVIGEGECLCLIKGEVNDDGSYEESVGMCGQGKYCYESVGCQDAKFVEIVDGSFGNYTIEKNEYLPEGRIFINNISKKFMGLDRHYFLDALLAKKLVLEEKSGYLVIYSDGFGNNYPDIIVDSDRSVWIDGDRLGELDEGIEIIADRRYFDEELGIFPREADRRYFYKVNLIFSGSDYEILRGALDEVDN